MLNVRSHPIRPVHARLFALSLVSVLMACPPSSKPVAPPPAPVLVAGIANAALAPANGSTPAIVTIHSIPWQYGYYGADIPYKWGWLEDVLVGNPYSFQLRIQTDLLGSTFSVLDSAGTPLVSFVPRSNTSHPCLDATTRAPIAGSECYWFPGANGYITPRPTPLHESVYSIGLAPTCAGVLTPSRTDHRGFDRATHCAPGDSLGAAILLTLSPARPLKVNVPVRFTLVATNAAGSARTVFHAMFAPPPPNIGGAVIGTAPANPNTPSQSRCPGGALPQSFTFQMTSSPPATWNVAATACTRSEARAELLQIYAIELARTGWSLSA